MADFSLTKPYACALCVFKSMIFIHPLRALAHELAFFH
jgi:hypothetical protein